MSQTGRERDAGKRLSVVYEYANGDIKPPGPSSEGKCKTTPPTTKRCVANPESQDDGRPFTSKTLNIPYTRSALRRRSLILLLRKNVIRLMSARTCQNAYSTSPALFRSRQRVGVHRYRLQHRPHLDNPGVPQYECSCE